MQFDVKSAPNGHQCHDLYDKYHDQESKIRELLRKCGVYTYGTPADHAPPLKGLYFTSRSPCRGRASSTLLSFVIPTLQEFCAFQVHT